MFEPQHLINLQDSHQAGAGGGAGNDAMSWLSGHHSAASPTSLRRTLSSLNNAASAGTLDPVLFNDLVQMVPLVESLIDRKPNSSFTRRGSVIYTKTPSRESLARKTGDVKARNGDPSNLKRNKAPNKNLGIDQDGTAENLSLLSSRSLPTEKDMEELLSLREQVEDLRRKLSEKDEMLKSREAVQTEMEVLQAKLSEIKMEAAEKDALLKTTQLQLSDMKIHLADKQAAVEKLGWEAMTSNQRVEKLQKDLGVVEGEISTLMQVIEGLSRNSSAPLVNDYDEVPYSPHDNSDLDPFDEVDLQELEAAREAYTLAVATAKEKQDEESIAAAAKARLHLQSLVIQQIS